MFRAARVDYSLHRLYHYTGTDPEHFQNFVIFTNYQFYVDAFARICRERMAAGDPAADAFVEPGNVITAKASLGNPGPTHTPPERPPQMPAFHLVQQASRGISMINIGTGPSNARNITDHVAVLRPHAWLMLGIVLGCGTRRSSAITSSLTDTSARITCWMKSCRCGYRFRRLPRRKSRSSKQSAK
jgi:AMP nucleosidase